MFLAQSRLSMIMEHLLQLTLGAEGIVTMEKRLHV